MKSSNIIALALSLISLTTGVFFVAKRMSFDDQKYRSIVETVKKSTDLWDSEEPSNPNEMIASFGELEFKESKNLLPKKPSSNLQYYPLPKKFLAGVDKWEGCESMREIQDQGHCGSCWAVATASVISDRICIGAGGKSQFRASAYELMTCCENCKGKGKTDACKGGHSSMAAIFYKTNGIANSSCKPYPYERCAHHVNSTTLKDCQELIRHESGQCAANCTSNKPPGPGDKDWAISVYLVEGEEEMAREIYENGPIVASFHVYDDFLTYKKGIYHHVTGKYRSPHAIRILGFGEERGVKYWVVANSWNEEWGEKGIVRFLRGSNHCNIETSAFAMTS